MCQCQPNGIRQLDKHKENDNLQILLHTTYPHLFINFSGLASRCRDPFLLMPPKTSLLCKIPLHTRAATCQPGAAASFFALCLPSRFRARFQICPESS